MVFLMMKTWCSKHVEDTKNWVKTLIRQVCICWFNLPNWITMHNTKNIKLICVWLPLCGGHILFSMQVTTEMSVTSLLLHLPSYLFHSLSKTVNVQGPLYSPPPLAIDWGCGWAIELVWVLWRRGESLTCADNCTMIAWTSSRVTILTIISQLCPFIKHTAHNHRR